MLCSENPWLGEKIAIYSLPSSSPPPLQHLEKPVDDRAHMRRASDEASQILRNLSSSAILSGGGSSLMENKGVALSYPGRQMTFPPSEGMMAHSFNEGMFIRPPHYPLGERGLPGCLCGPL